MKKFLSFLFLLFCSLSKGVDAAADHGMVLFGEDKLYLSHLGMYHSPHQYQAIFEISFSDTDKARIQADRRANPKELYTLLPEKFILKESLAEKTKLKATLFRGHFEKEGKPILNAVTFFIDKVIHFRELKAEGASPTKWTGILFGTTRETYLAHWIGPKPNFDQILKIKTQRPSTFSVLTQKLQSTLEVVSAKDANGPLEENAKNLTLLLEGAREKEPALIEKQIYFSNEDFQN